MFAEHPVMTIVALRRLRAEAAAAQGVDQAAVETFSVASALPIQPGAAPGTDPLTEIGQVFDDHLTAAGIGNGAILAGLNWLLATSRRSGRTC